MEGVDRREHVQRAHDEASFFRHLPCRGSLDRFTRMDLATGKAPLPRVRLIRAADE